MSAKTIEFFFDCSSPWTWLAFHRLREMAKAQDVTVDWRPILVGVVFNSINPSVYQMREAPVKPKWDYMAKDLADWAKHTGLRILWTPSIFPVNSAAAMRGCLFADQHGVLEDFADKVFRAYWSDDRDIADRAVLSDIAAACSLNPEEFAAAIDSDALRAALKANTSDLIERGGFGSPTMFINGEDMYFGNDRLELMFANIT